MSYELIHGLVVAGCALAVFSILYKETIVFRVAEHIYIGLGIGYVLFQGVDRVIKYVWTPVTTKGEWIWMIPLILGLLIYTRFIPSLRWISRWPMAIVIGSGVGLAMGGLVATMIVSLIVKTITLDFTNVSNIIFLIITFTCIAYFILTKEHTGNLGYITKVGRFFMMGAFGASMASNVFSFTSRLGGVVQQLVTYPGYFVTALAFILIVIDTTLLKKE